jgi:heat shock protein HslJ
MRKTLIFAAFLGLTLAACADPADEAAADPTETAWVLESGTVDGAEIALVDSHPITLTFDEGQAGGSAGCNTYGAAYEISGAEISFDEAISTMMACEPTEVMDAETAYLTALDVVTGFSATEDSLTLTGEGVELVFGVDEAA